MIDGTDFRVGIEDFHVINRRVSALFVIGEMVIRGHRNIFDIEHGGTTEIGLNKQTLELLVKLFLVGEGTDGCKAMEEVRCGIHHHAHHRCVVAVGIHQRVYFLRSHHDTAVSQNTLRA